MKTLSDLVVGDEVFYFNGYHHIENVERVTTNFIVVKGEKFSKKSGERRKDGCYSAITAPKEGEIEEFKQDQQDKRLRNEMSRADLSNLPIEKLRKIKEIIEST